MLTGFISVRRRAGEGRQGGRPAPGGLGWSACLGALLVGCGGDPEPVRSPGAPDAAVTIPPSGDGGLRGSVPCEVCQIDLELTTVITDSHEAVDFGDQRAIIRRDRRGRTFVRPVPWHYVAVFDEQGRFLRSLGSAGEGPGEFMSAAASFVDHSDSLWVWDSRLGRATVYSSDLDFGRTVRFPVVPQYALPDGSILGLQQLTGDPDRVGYPAHLATRDGEIIRSFGADPPEYRADQRNFFVKTGAPTRDGLVWMTTVGRFELELWDPKAGVLLRSLRPEVAWFEESPTIVGDFRLERPQSYLNNVWTDSLGIVWVLGQTAAEDWEPCCQGGPAPHTPSTVTSYQRYWDWLLLAIHPETGHLLAERRFRDQTWGTGGGGELVTITIDEAALSVSYSLWRPVLVESRDGG